MLAESAVMNSPNYQNKIRLSIRPDFLEATNIRSKDPILIIYEDDQIVIKRQKGKDDIGVEDIIGYREKAKEYEKFYVTLEKDVKEFIGSGERKGSMKIDNIFSEAKDTLPGIEIDKKIFLKEMRIHFKEQGIKMDISPDKGIIVFWVDDHVKKEE
jgi:hypothetical protein